jgi:lipoprotein-anchoring transpeptidase ErfK/SrfK
MHSHDCKSQNDSEAAGAKSGPAAGPARDLMTAAWKRLRACLASVPRRWLLVSVTEQRLALVEDGRILASYPVSTAAAGLDSREGSRGTPPGVHAIAGKIGDGMEPGTVFESRVPTGAVWKKAGGRSAASDITAETAASDASDADNNMDLILSRILTLQGEEEGLNRGPGCDSLARFIYIHGTNHEARLGAPVSGGCVRMSSADVIDLFARVQKGDPVVIL